MTQSNLRILWIGDTQLNDVGKEHLRKLANLKWLVVENLSSSNAFDELFELLTRQQEFSWRIAEISAFEESIGGWESGDWEPALTVTKFR